ncbi:SLATT domain-containing protein [Vibrio parahaemolyticus]|nr:SLATT domain-containing protein [Vibrio parahaemolyticus]
MKSYEYLHKRVLVTSKARYEASKRLRLHSWCSQWTLAFLAVGQIVLALFATFDLVDDAVTKNQIDMASLFFAVVVLTYSLLLGMGDFSARSSNIHQCGLELAELSRKLHYRVTHQYQSTEHEYLDFVNRYYICLNRHENHVSHDYLIARLDYLIEHGNKPSKFDMLFNYKLKIYWYRVLGFSHYIFSITLLVLWSWHLVSFS